MATIKVCDRCGALAAEPSKPGGVPVPATDPATNSGAVDMDVSIDVQTPGADFCVICRTSALAEYVLARTDRVVLQSIVAALSTRIKTVLVPTAAETGVKPA